jgi:hypothetical protein
MDGEAIPGVTSMSILVADNTGVAPCRGLLPGKAIERWNIGNTASVEIESMVASKLISRINSLLDLFILVVIDLALGEAATVLPLTVTLNSPLQRFADECLWSDTRQPLVETAKILPQRHRPLNLALWLMVFENYRR